MRFVVVDSVYAMLTYNKFGYACVARECRINVDGGVAMCTCNMSIDIRDNVYDACIMMGVICIHLLFILIIYIK